jgi:ABC-2 type transport system ATP-binding protein
MDVPATEQFALGPCGLKTVNGLSVQPPLKAGKDRTTLITVSNMSKKFGTVTAVDAISFEVFEGEIFGLVGLNGAGKTTTMLILSSLLNPNSGSASVCGYDVMKEKDDVRRSIGFVFEEEAVDIYLTGRQNLDFAARMYSLSRQERERMVASVLKTVGLEQHANSKVRNYSGGMLRRLEIARGMLTSPRVLLLDEPTIGLDVQTRRYVWDYIRRTNREMGVTALLATSYLDEADYLCNRIAILHEGRIVATGTPEALKASIGENLITFKLSKGSPEEFAGVLQEMHWVKSIESRGNGTFVLSLKDKSIGIPGIVRMAKAHGFGITSIQSSTPSLNDVLLHYTKKDTEGA